MAGAYSQPWAYLFVVCQAGFRELNVQQFMRHLLRMASCFALRLMAMRVLWPWASQVEACCAAVEMIHRPMLPLVGWVQRTSTSTPVNDWSASSSLGW